MLCQTCLPYRDPGDDKRTWERMNGLTVRQMQAYVGAAIFTDGTEWGNAKRLAERKKRRGRCQWPGA